MKFIKSSYYGVLIDKYLDKNNHNFKTLILTINNKDSSLVLTNDTSSFYSIIRVGDTLIKNLNTDLIEVKKRNKSYKYKIYFGCND